MLDESMDFETDTDLDSSDTGEFLDLSMESEDLNDESMCSDITDVIPNEGGFPDLENMSIDELKELKEDLISQNDVEEIDVEDVTSDLQPDYSYHWDGGPTHNTEWDDVGDEDPNVLERVLRR